MPTTQWFYVMAGARYVSSATRFGAVALVDDKTQARLFEESEADACIATRLQNASAFRVPALRKVPA